MTTRSKLLIGAIATLAIAELYHGPFGAAAELESRIERRARTELDRNEMFQVQARLGEKPLTRTLILSGPADGFQRGALVEVMGELPGVDSVEWDPSSLPADGARP
jgi:hypothetical protein